MRVLRRLRYTIRKISRAHALCTRTRTLRIADTQSATSAMYVNVRRTINTGSSLYVGEYVCPSLFSFVFFSFFFPFSFVFVPSSLNVQMPFLARGRGTEGERQTEGGRKGQHEGVNTRGGT